MSRSPLALGVILLVALGLRAPGVFCSDELEDEDYYLRGAALMLERGSPRLAHPPRYPYQNPSGYHAAAAATMFLVDSARTGGVGGGEGMVARYRGAPRPFILAGRLVSCLAGLLAIVAVWFAARRIAGPVGALTAAALLAVSPLHVRYSFTATNDALLCAFTALCALLLIRYLAAPSGGAAARLGVALGAAGATKYRAILLLPLVVVATLRRPDREGGRTPLLWAGAGALAALLLLFPALVLEPSVVLESLQRQSALPGGVWPGASTDPIPLQHLATLLRALGPLALLLALLGLAPCVRDGRLELALYPAVHLAVFLPMSTFFIRHDLPLVVFLCLLAAGPAAAALAAVRRRCGRPAAAFALALVVLPPAGCSTRIAHLMTAPDTRADLRAWLTARLDAGERLKLAYAPGAIQGIPRGVRHDRLDPRVAGARLVLGLTGEPAPDLPEALRRRGGLLILTSSDVDWSPARRAFEAEIAARARLVHRIDAGVEVPDSLEEWGVPWDHLLRRGRPGPNIRVYALDPGE